MRRSVPVVVAILVVAVAALAWKQGWIPGFGGAGNAESGPEVVPDASTAETGLAGHGKSKLPDEDPKTFEGDPVGVLTFELGKAIVVGRVTSDGQPVRFARVLPILAPPDEGRAVRTTKAGAFEIRGLPAGGLDLRVAAEGLWSRTVRTADLVDGVTTDVGEIVLKARPPQNDGLEVKVLGPDGRPVPGARVTASTMTYRLVVTMGSERSGVPAAITVEQMTDDNGVARMFPMAAEKYDVVVRAKGFVVEPVETVVVAAGRVEHLTVALTPGLSISGIVQDAEGAAVPGAFVATLGYPSFRQYELASTDAQGAFTIDGLMPGGYWVMAGKDGKGQGMNTTVEAGNRGVRVQLKGAGTVTGKVVTKGGAPVQAFTVRAFTSQPFEYVFSRPTRVADAEGKFTLPLAPGAYRIEAKADGSGLGAATSISLGVGETKNVVIELPEEGVVRGVVTDADGNHLAGAEVYVKLGGFPPTPSRDQYARSDADGHFEVKALPIEQVKLHVHHATQALSQFDAMPAPADKAKEVTFRLTKGARVEGHVLHSDGTPVQGERVNLSQGFDFFMAKTVFTDASGAFAFDSVAAGSYSVSTGRFENAASGQQRNVVVPASGVVTVEFKSEGDAEATGTVSGSVSLAGTAVAGASLFAVDDRGMNAAISTKTEADGRFVLKGLRPGRISVTASTDAGLQTTEYVRIREVGGTATLDFQFGRCGVRGTLVGSDGRTTIPGAWILAEVAEKGTPGGWDDVRGNVNSTNDGSFSLLGVNPGTYRLRISGTGYAAKTTDPFPVADGETVNLGTIRLAPGGGISGRVTDEGGAPLENVGIIVKNSRGEDVFGFSMSSTGSNGRYGVEGLEYGNYTVKFDAKGFAPLEKPVQVTAAGAVADGVMRKGGTLVVSVQDANGQGISGARVVLYDAAGQEVRKTLTLVNLFDADVSRTGAAGTTRIPDLAPGAYKAGVTKDGLVLVGDPVPFSVAPGAEASVTLVMKAP